MGKLILFFCTSYILFVCPGCNQLGRGEEDMLIIHRNAGGEKIREGELVELTAVEKTESGWVIWNSTDYDRTALVTRGLSVFTGDLFAALGKLGEGDSATIRVSRDSMVNKMGLKLPPHVQDKFIIYDVSIRRVLHKDGLSGSAYQQLVNRFMQERLNRLKQGEASKISSYIATQHLQTAVRPSGLQYLISAPGHGEAASAGDTIEVKYMATLLSGFTIDSANHTPRTWVVGSNQTIAGLEETFRLFGEGTKATVIIPSGLAFGEAGYEGIQPYTPLVYQLEIVRIRRLVGKPANETGAAMPVFAFTNIVNDVIIQNEDLPRGPVVWMLINTSCDHCQHLVQAIDQNQLQLQHLNLYIVALEPAAAIRDFIQQHAPGLFNKKNIMILEDRERRFAPAFQPASVPSVYIYNQQHILVKHIEGNVSVKDISHN